MSLLKSEQFVCDVERQYDWYAERASCAVADRYIAAVEATFVLIESLPKLGPKVIHCTHVSERGATSLCSGLFSGISFSTAFWTAQP